VLIYIYKKQTLVKSLKYLLTSFLAGMVIFSSFLPFPGGLGYTVVNPQCISWAHPLQLYLVAKEKFSKRLHMVLSTIPLVFMYACYNPLQFVSAVVIWEGWNYPPCGDLVIQLSPAIFNNVTIVFAISLSCVVSLFSLVSIKRRINDDLSRAV